MPQFKLDTSGVIVMHVPQFAYVAFDDLDSFTQAYIEAAFFTSDEEVGDKGYSDLTPETLASILADCNRFQSSEAYLTVREAEDNEELGDLFEADGGVSSQAGHDFWLTRNGHGAGFWDGDWPEPHGEALCGVADAFPDVSLYVGGDGKIYT